jgi:hypothetical protein
MLAVISPVAELSLARTIESSNRIGLHGMPALELLTSFSLGPIV